MPEETAKPDTTIKETITSSSVMYATENDITIKWDAMPEAEGYELNISYSNVNYTIETSDTTFKNTIFKCSNYMFIPDTLL